MLRYYFLVIQTIYTFTVQTTVCTLHCAHLPYTVEAATQRLFRVKAYITTYSTCPLRRSEYTHLLFLSRAKARICTQLRVQTSRNYCKYSRIIIINSAACMQYIRLCS